MADIQIITIDGPSGSGKGTLALSVAQKLGFHLLDSGAIYRLLALHSLNKGIELDQQDQVMSMFDDFEIRFETGEELAIPFLNNVDASAQIRQESTGKAASIVSQHVKVRQHLLSIQRDFAKPPGLVTDGRDMGTAVFPKAQFKFYLYASPEIRAQRRYKQLISMGISASIAELQEDISERDERDQNRSESPLKPAEDAIIVDSSLLDLSQVCELVLSHITNDRLDD